VTTSLDAYEAGTPNDRSLDALPAPVVLTIGRQVVIEPGYPAELRRAVHDRFTLPNPAYQDALRFDRDTRDLPERLLYYDVRPDGALIVPRGALELVYRDVRALGLEPRWTDETHMAAPVAFEERITLSDAQERAVGEVLRRRMGLLEAPAGSGKTCMGLVAVARRQQPALWLTHTKELARQAVERAGMVLGLAPDEVGFIGDGECRVGQWLTVALVQSLARGIPPALLNVAHVVLDEAHHAPAEQVAAVIAQFPARYLLGLSATPYRRDGLDAVIGFHVGPVVARIDKADLADRLIAPRIIKRDTGLRPAGDSFTELVSDLVVWPERNALIAEDVAEAVACGRRCLVLSERVGHVKEVTRLLQERGIAAAALYGTLGKRKRGEVVDALGAGELHAVVATGSLVGEGFDSPRTDALFLATPVSYHGRVVQYLGRVSRTAPGKVDALVVDYCDDNGMLWSTWRNRRLVYEAQGCPIATSPASPAVAIWPRRSA
jgi:superfamily II DNA or RNA helicase